MISLLRFKGRRVAALVLRGAACLTLMVSPLSPWWSWSRCGAPAPSVCCLAPDGLNSRTPTSACPPSQGETSDTLGVLVHDVVGPSPPEHRVMGRRRRIRHPVRSRDSGYDTSPGAVTCHITLDDVNTPLLQYAPNLLNIIHIHASNTDTTLDLAVTVLNNFELKRDTVQTENDLPAQ